MLLRHTGSWEGKATQSDADGSGTRKMRVWRWTSVANEIRDDTRRSWGDREGGPLRSLVGSEEIKSLYPLKAGNPNLGTDGGTE